MMTPEKEAELLGLILPGIIFAAIYFLSRWVAAAPRTADPWDSSIEDALQGEDAVPVCANCFAPQSHDGWFCPECGSTVGRYCNYLPFVYIFSEGEVFRNGTSKKLRRSLPMALGYVLGSLASYGPFAPFYWIALFFNYRKTRRAEDPLSSQGASA